MVRLFLLVAAVALLSSCGGCTPCDANDASKLDYDVDDSWACRPGADDVCARDLTAAEVALDGTVTVTPHEVADDPPLACFWVYPTVDLTGTPDTHEDFEDTTLEDEVVAVQAARLSEACTVHAPYYRQVNIGVYTALVDAEERASCFEVPIVDIISAFEVFLEDIGDDRPIMVGGHSQGAQMVTALVQRVIEERDSVLERLAVAMPIGWPLGVDEGELDGGAFHRVPLCSAPDETGCAIAYRSYGAGNDMPESPNASEVRKSLFVGDEVACTHPGGEDGATLSRSYFPARGDFVEVPEAAAATEAPYVLYRDTFNARCERDGDNAGLELSPVAGRESVIDFSRILLSGDSGSHLLDVHFAQGDLIDQAAARGAAWVAARQPAP